MADTKAVADEMSAGRELWTRVNAEYGNEHAARVWTAEDITWGVFDIPERQVGVLGEVDGLDVVELGCGTAYFSAWLARRGARPVGVDLTAAQLETARACQRRFGITFPLIEADAGNVPLADGRFDLVISECGASLWCDPARWVPEAARLLRPGGRLVFHTTSVLVALCLPDGLGLRDGAGLADRHLLRPQRAAARLQTSGGWLEFHPGHGDWIQILRAAGFLIDALHELYAPPGASTHPYYHLAPAPWAQHWPVEEIWAAHLPERRTHDDRVSPGRPAGR
jgi:SAM-dependent methyltransferase